MTQTQMETTAPRLLTPLWRGIPGDYKSKYAREIWRQFEDNVKAAAHTITLSQFLSAICSRLQIALREADVPAVAEIVRGGHDRALLRFLREETTTAVLLVRLENEQRRVEWEADHANG